MRTNLPNPQSDQPELIPARMLNAYAYCPRLCYLEWVQGELADSAETLEGRVMHRRVDTASGDLDLPAQPCGDGDSESIHARSVTLSDDLLGVIARLDLVEADGVRATPVEYKRGTVPDVPGHSYEPERIQICVQGLLLRSNGFECDVGELYYVGSKRRVTVPLDDDLVKRTTELLDSLRGMATARKIPPPLEDSPKCPRCSLVGICLPDEVTYLNGANSVVRPDDIRRLVPARDDALPVYVTTQGSVVGKSGEVLKIRKGREELAETRLIDVSSLSVFGNIQITPAALRELQDRSIPICHFSYGGWFRGVTWGMGHKNVELRIAQYRVASEAENAVLIARDLVAAKLHNSRVLLRRNHPAAPTSALDELSRLIRRARSTGSLDILLGIEGAGARVYFSKFNDMLNTGEPTFEFQNRNRRPPRDPVNAVLSFLYGMLVRQTVVSAIGVGLDPFLGFYHQPRYGRPALALDLAEEFRPLLADSTVLRLFNNRELKQDDFISRSGAVSLTPQGRKSVIKAFERRLDTLITHPIFGYSISYRRVLEVQARLLGRHVLGELPQYPAFTTR